VDALAGRTVLEGATAPDGYQLQLRTNGGSGIVGDVFGMGRYRQNVGLVKGGRVVSIELPPPYQNPYAASVSAVGWVTGEKAR
jgi:hypothetical protein